MAQFLYGSSLNAALVDLFKNAEEYLVLISPFIKLHERDKDELKSKIPDPNFQLKILFGKNEEDKSKSIGDKDIEFFTSFSNVEIRYEKRLHAKFYYNEKSSILASMNLYDYSQNNNIEAGIALEPIGQLKKLTGQDDLDSQTFNYFESLFKSSDLIFQKVPKVEISGLLGLSKKYVGSEIKVDKLKDYFNKSFNKKTYSNPSEISKSPERKEFKAKPTTGYCIRTGVEIPFNPLKPMCTDAYHEWAKYKNMNYKEVYDHLTGKKSFGKTSMRKPILE